MGAKMGAVRAAERHLTCDEQAAMTDNLFALSRYGDAGIR
jgi:hypothetical protein